ncbi:hypothetical protein [Candidatus Sulfurimonas baltica]|uniref:Uncharacterized protein n=1 Tax=Candidatus Sulfurimonas baltica TaxID=2740404 RepID=A0A7S7LX36_9BACT|nr:hypothetical protein [Candidatus Sulfurimonas baltica]QOY52473.1 hypothetical protein HUE88_01895 [Candidatus Sulfurimonas baltica]
MDKSYIAYYLRRLYHHVYFKELVKEYDTSISDEYFQLYKEVLHSKNLNNSSNDEDFLCDFVADLEGFRFNININLKKGTKEYSEALVTFKQLQMQIRQIDIIMMCEKNLGCIHDICHDKLFQIKEKKYRDYPIVEEILELTHKRLLTRCSDNDRLESINQVWMRTPTEAQKILNNTFEYVAEMIGEISLPNEFTDIAPKTSNKKTFEEVKTNLINNIENLSFVFLALLTSDERKWRMHKKDNFLSFMLDDYIEKVKISPKKEEVYIFYDLYMALNKSCTTTFYVKYFQNIGAKKDFPKKINELRHLYGSTYLYTQLLLYKSLFSVRKDFKHLSTILIGIELGLDVNRINNLANAVDNISNKKIKKIKNKNIASNYEKITQVLDKHWLVEEKIINFRHDKDGQSIIYT